MVKKVITASFILGSFGAVGTQLKAEEFAYNDFEPKNKFFLLDPDSGSQKKFYYLIKDKDKYSATKQRLVELQGLEINRFEHLKNTLLQTPKTKK